jgi:hypothetical protein
MSDTRQKVTHLKTVASNPKTRGATIRTVYGSSLRSPLRAGSSEGAVTGTSPAN